MKLIIFFLFTLTSLSYGQDLNNYKYILVPEKFEEMKEVDQYRLNGLTNYLFNESGFTSVLGKSNLPEEAFKNNCLVLNAELINTSGVFQTKIAIQLKNCRDEVVYTSPIGKSGDKKYIVAYNDALRTSLKGLSNLNYRYSPKKEIDNNEVVQMVESKTETPNSSEKPLQIENNNKIISKVDSKLETNLNAKRINNTISDFQLFSPDGNLMYTLLYSGREEVFLVKDRQAIIYKKESVWVLADRANGDLTLKVLDITFN
jgi:hypothetical protein